MTRAVLIAGTAVLLASTIPAMSAAATSSQHLAVSGLASAPVLDPSAVQHLTDPGVELTPPVDGRLRGDGIALVVTGGALTDQAGQAAEAASAGPGNYLIVFGLRQIPQPDHSDLPPAVLALVVAGQRRKVDLAALSGGTPAFFVASVPAASTDVMLELSVSAFSQRFNLMTLTRPGPDPVVMYRDSEGPEVISELTGGVNVAATVVSNGDLHHVTYSIPTARLRWFSPLASSGTAPASDRAYLIVTVIEKPVKSPQSNLWLEPFYVPFPTDRMHIRLEDGTQIGGAKIDAPPSGRPSGDIQGTYYFVVPATLTSATLVVDASQAVSVLENGGSGGYDAPVSVAAFSLPITLSVPPPIPPSTSVTTLKLTGANRTPAANAAPTAPKTKSERQAPLWLVVVLLAGAGTAVWLTLRGRRRRSNGHPVVASGAPTTPSGLSAAAGLPSRPPVDTSGNGASPDPVAAPRTTVGAANVTPPVDGPFHPTGLEPATPQVVAQPATAERPPEAGDTEPSVVGTASVAVGTIPRRAAVGLLGPLDINGAGTAKLRGPELEILVYLVTQDGRPVTNDDIRGALGQGADDEPSKETVRTYLSRIRKAVGPEALPEAENGRYRLADVDSDIARFTRLTTAAAASEPTHAAKLLTEALQLVRGRPFADLDYRWATLIIANLETRIAATADRLAALARERRDTDTSRWAAAQGLQGLVQPDDRLLGHLLRAGAAHSQSQLTAAWREINARLAAVGDAPSAEVVALYDRLRNGQDTF